jgi:hypothetical protein
MNKTTAQFLCSISSEFRNRHLQNTGLYIYSHASNFMSYNLNCAGTLFYLTTRITASPQNLLRDSASSSSRCCLFAFSCYSRFYFSTLQVIWRFYWPHFKTGAWNVFHVRSISNFQKLRQRRCGDWLQLSDELNEQIWSSGTRNKSGATYEVPGLVIKVAQLMKCRDS